MSTENQQQIALAQQQRKQDIDGNLERLIGLASFDQAWNEEVRGVLVEYASLVGEGSDELSDKNRRVAELYVDDAERLRLAQRFENAGRQLDRATRYAPDLASLANEREALGRNQLALEESVRQRRLEAGIEGAPWVLTGGARDFLSSIGREMEIEDRVGKPAKSGRML